MSSGGSSSKMGWVGSSATSIARRPSRCPQQSRASRARACPRHGERVSAYASRPRRASRAHASRARASASHKNPLERETREVSLCTERVAYRRRQCARWCVPGESSLEREMLAEVERRRAGVAAVSTDASAAAIWSAANRAVVRVCAWRTKITKLHLVLALYSSRIKTSRARKFFRTTPSRASVPGRVLQTGPEGLHNQIPPSTRHGSVAFRSALARVGT